MAKVLSAQINFLKLQWQQTVAPFALGSAEVEGIFQELVNLYTQPSRFYHNLAHIQQVLATIHQLSRQAQNLPAIQLAAWFHDAIYDSHSQDNEDKSADYALVSLARLNCPISTTEQVLYLIRQTKFHQASSVEIDSQILLDADLAILSASPALYQVYQQTIRQEYGWLDDQSYRQGRKLVLEAFLSRDKIYQIETFSKHHEQQALANLKREISILSSMRVHAQPKQDGGERT